MRWKDFDHDIQVDWVRMAQGVLRYGVVVVGRLFNKGSLVSEACRGEHQEDFDDEPDGPPERMTTVNERRERLQLNRVPEGAVCVRSSGAPPPRGARLTSAEWRNLFYRMI